MQKVRRFGLTWLLNSEKTCWILFCKPTEKGDREWFSRAAHLNLAGKHTWSLGLTVIKQHSWLTGALFSLTCALLGALSSALFFYIFAFTSGSSSAKCLASASVSQTKLQIPLPSLVVWSTNGPANEPFPCLPKSLKHSACYGKLDGKEALSTTTIKRVMKKKTHFFGCWWIAPHVDKQIDNIRFVHCRIIVGDMPRIIHNFYYFTSAFWFIMDCNFCIK